MKPRGNRLMAREILKSLKPLPAIEGLKTVGN